MIELRIARRYFWAVRRRMHTAMLAVISMLGLAIGVFALLFSIALLSGLQGQIKGRLIASSPQLLIEPVGSMTLVDSEAIVAAAKSLGARDIRPTVAGIGWAFAPALPGSTTTKSSSRETTPPRSASTAATPSSPSRREPA